MEALDIQGKRPVRETDVGNPVDQRLLSPRFSFGSRCCEIHRHPLRLLCRDPYDGPRPHGPEGVARVAVISATLPSAPL